MAADNGLRPPRPLDVASLGPSEWEDWLQSYNWYTSAVQLNKKPPEVQVANFMTAIGTDAQKIYKTFALSEAESKEVEVVKAKFKEHFTPKINPAYERYKFNKMKQQEGESFTDFLTTARLQAKKCQFGNLTDELLRDRIIVGISNDDVREKLLGDPTIDLEKAIHLCRASEQATLQLKEMTAKETKTVDVVNAKTKKNSSHQTDWKKNCKYCGSTHRRAECPAYGKTCNSCRKVGHFAAVCKSKKVKNQ